jgi:hypothetical protein
MITTHTLLLIALFSAKPTGWCLRNWYNKQMAKRNKKIV